MGWKWIELSVVMIIHERQIAEHGGMHGVRDMGLIESALARPKHLARYGSPDVFDLAAAYGHGLARNHGFIDGNKRTAYVTTRLFLRLHGQDITASNVERVLVFENLAKGEVETEDFASWLRERW